MKYKNVSLIINPVAGRERPILQAVHKAFSPSKINWDVFISKQVGDAKKLAVKAVQQGTDVVAVYGGDGTVMDIAGALVGTRVPMLILRGGTGNIFASEMNLPQDITESCQLLFSRSSREKDVDVGQQGDSFFLLRCSVGFEAHVVKNADRDLKSQVGTLAYAIGAFQAFVGNHPALYQLELDGRKLDVEALSCIIANSGNLGLPGLKLAPDISVDDGWLDVIVLRYPNMDALFSMASYVIDKRASSESFYHWKAKQIKVSTLPAQEVQSDGEFLGKASVDIKVLPRALRVIVPETCG